MRTINDADGLVERWVAHNGGAKADTGKPAAGTPTFWSLAVHNGSDAGRKDDVESMVRLGIIFCFWVFH